MKDMMKNKIPVLLFCGFTIFSAAILMSCKQAAEPQPPKRRDPTEAEQYFIDKIRKASGSEITIALSDRPNKISDLGYIYEALYELTEQKKSVLVNLDLSGVAGNVTSIQNYEFEGCENLKSLVITHGISSIGAKAFSGCKKLEKIEIYAGRVYGGRHSPLAIGNNAFEGCEKLTTIKYKDYSNSRGEASTDVFFSTIGQGAFFGTALTQDSINFVIENIATTSTVPKDGKTRPNVSTTEKTISAQEFAKINFTSGSITIPEVTSIGSGAFANTNLSSVTFSKPAAITTLAGFDNCSSINATNINLAQFTALTTIGTAAFSSTGFSGDVNIPGTVTEIGGNAFSDTKITSITIPAGVETLGASAFSDCAELTKVTFGGNKIKAIDSGTFKGDKKLNNITIPTNVETIGDSAFEGCEALTAITIPANVKSIGKNAFKGCSKLKTITANGAPASLGAGVFDGLPNDFEIKTTDALYTSAWHEYTSHIKVQ